MRLKILSITGIALIVGAGLYNCETKDPTEALNTGDVLMPLKTGNKWDYNYSYINPVIGDIKTKDSSITVIALRRDIDQSSYFELSDGRLARNTEEGLFIANYDYSARAFYNDLFFVYPAVDGHVYVHETLDMRGHLTIKVTRESVTVPAGTFDCYVYHLLSEPYASYDSAFYFAHRIGLIQVKNYDQKGKDLILKTYQLK